jgi:RNA recognition motif-containing protein
LYVGNLSFRTQDETLRATIANYGEVTSAEIIIDRVSGQSRGFGFVEMPNQAEAQAAMAALDGSNLEGRTLRVTAARARTAQPPRQGGYGRPNDRRY